MRYRLRYTNQARKDARKLSAAGLDQKAKKLLAIIETDPYKSPPRFVHPVGNLGGALSRRINIQHRLVYQVVEEEKVIKVLRMWTHYE